MKIDRRRLEKDLCTGGGQKVSTFGSTYEVTLPKHRARASVGQPVQGQPGHAPAQRGRVMSYAPSSAA
jgi:hypothetical protein